MSIQNIKDEINTFSGKQAKSILSFLGRSDLKSFSHKRKISNAIQSVFIDFMESKREEIIPKKQRKRVFFADDITLPSSEIAPLVSQTIEHIVSEEEYVEIISYKDCYKNEDFLDGMRRRCEEQKKKQEEKETIELLQILPKEVEDIINQDIAEMEHTEKFTPVLNELHSHINCCAYCNQHKFDKSYNGNSSDIQYEFICKECEREMFEVHHGDMPQIYQGEEVRFTRFEWENSMEYYYMNYE